MPMVLRVGPYRFFYSNEGTEAPHVHVQKGRNLAKFWLEPVSLAASRRFKGHELARVEGLVSENRDRLTGAWNEFFGS